MERPVQVQQRRPATTTPSPKIKPHPEGKRDSANPGDRSSVRRRAALLRIGNVVATKEVSSIDSALLGPNIEYPHKRETRNSQRKLYRSAARQGIFTHARVGKSGEAKLPSNWRTVLAFLSKHTRRLDDLFEFNVVVEKGFASAAMDVLSRTDTNVWQIQKRTNCVIRLDEVDKNDGTLTLSLSGTEDSVRLALSEVLKAAGRLTAVRLADPNGNELFLDLWLRKESDNAPVGLNEGEVQLDDHAVAVTRHMSPVDLLQRPPSYYSYMLTRRADELEAPSEWTTSSFEAHIASLVYGVIPPHLFSKLYRHKLDHQHVVVSLLVKLFSSDTTRTVLSRNALNMALAFIQRRGIAFRSSAQIVFDQAQVHNVPMDTPTCNQLLYGCVKSKDLDGFESVLKLMVRKGYHPDRDSWLAFLRLLDNADVKRQVLRKMRTKGLDRVQSTLVKIGQTMATYDLELALPQLKSIAAFISFQDRIYGPDWLDRTTLNRVIDLLGKYGRLDFCHELLDSIYTSGRVRPDVVTLNTVISHCRSVVEQISTMKTMRLRWDHIVLDEVTYEHLSKVAWLKRGPNMLRVIWHYAGFAKQTSSKMRYRIYQLLKGDIGDRVMLLKNWRDAVVGEEALAKLQGQYDSDLYASVIANWHGATARSYRPQISFEDKLAEAYGMDRQIHGRIRQGELMAAETRKSLTVAIPLVPRGHFQTKFLLPALSGNEGSLGTGVVSAKVDESGEARGATRSLRKVFK